MIADNSQLAGVVEADETYIGGLMKNMHKSKRERIRQEVIQDRTERASNHPQLGRKRHVGTGLTGGAGKTLVQAVLERDGEVRAQILKTFGTFERLEFIHENVEEGSNLMTDTGNAWAGPKFVHEFINHQEQYVRGNVHTNSVENFWSLLQRGLRGTYVSVEPFHLSAYVDEQCFRFNTRKVSDGERFERALAATKGCRLTYEKLTRAN